MLLSVEHLSFAYPAENGDGVPFSLEEISFDLKEGELLGILGPNGAGKSTLLRLLAGVLQPSEGRVAMAGRPLGAMTPREAARAAALVPQEIQSAFAVTVEEMVFLGRFPHEGFLGLRSGRDRDVVEDCLRQTDLWALRHRLTSHLSGGERRRLLLARALAQEPRLLLLDEPTAHLDPRHQVDMLQRIERLRADKKLGVVAVLHDVNLAVTWCPRLLLMKGGRLSAQGSSGELLERGELSEVFGLSAEVMEDRRSGKKFINYYQFKKENPS